MFDSDFDTTDISEADCVDILGTDDVEFLDTSDIKDSSSDVAEMQNDDLLDLEHYHASRMSEEEVQAIDDLWNDEPKDDIEPYKATQLTEEQLRETEELWNEKTAGDIVEPYKATRLDHADDISDDSVDDSILDIGAQSLEEQFAAEVDAMSLDDLSKEHERLAALSEMDDLDIFAEFDNAQKGKYDSDLFDTLTDGLPKETLEQLRDGLAAGDPDVYEYFGLKGNAEDGNDGYPTLTRKR